MKLSLVLIIYRSNSAVAEESSIFCENLLKNKNIKSKRIESDFIKLNFDIGHFFCVNEDPADLILKLEQFIEHVHLEDISKDRVHNHLIPGHGAINFEKIFSNLEKIRYEGFITIELYPYLEQPEKAASEALNHLKSMI